MYTFRLSQLAVAFLLFLLSGNSLAQNNPAPAVDQASARDTVLYFAPKPEAGFNFGYFLYLPKGIEKGKRNYLMVETNNGGLSDSITHHEKTARHAAAKSGVGHYVSKKLQIPFLVPVFPRSRTEWLVYTHALDRDAILSTGTPIERLDLQLLAMVTDAKKQLAQSGYPVEEKIFMTGFSASGTFANRMSLLHPEKLKAVAVGGINAIAILPQKTLNGKTLNYPLGIADAEQITGKPVNLKAFRALPNLLYMGALDENDAAAFADGYSPEESQLVFEEMDKQLIPERWAFMEKTYRENNVQAEFRTYPNIGHGTDLKMLNDLADFFLQHSR